MTIHRTAAALAGFVIVCQLSACAGGLLGGGKPDNLYRFGTSESTVTTGPASTEQRTLLVEKARFAPEIAGDRLLAVHNERALYIKGSRWVTSAPSLFTQALLLSLQRRTGNMRITTMQSGDVSGYSLVATIAQFEAQYDDMNMERPPSVIISGDITLYALSDRKNVGQRHFVAQVLSAQNHTDDIVVAFDQATTCITTDIADWVKSTVEDQAQSVESVCAKVH